MTSDAGTKVTPVNETARGDLPVVGGRVTPEDRRIIDLAAIELGMKRGPFIVEAALERAKEVLRARRAEDTARMVARDSTAA
jgi:uncharacterized protein (DUF1778 family)